MNRVRGFIESLGVFSPSRRIVTEILKETGGAIIGQAINTYGHISNICLLNVEKVKARVKKALKERELESNSQIYMKEILGRSGL